MINLEPAGLDALIKYCEDLGLDATEILRQAAIDAGGACKLVRPVWAWKMLTLWISEETAKILIRLLSAMRRENGR